MKNISYYLTVAAVAATASTTLAGGFALHEMGARANAMQGAIVGSTKSASSVFYNPANQTELGDGWHVTAGLTVVAPDYDVTAGGRTTGQDNQLFPVPHVFITGKIAEDLYFGFGEYTEFGLGSSYNGGDNWVLSQDSVETTITGFTLSPTLAWQATDRLSLGAGFRAMYLELEYARKQDLGNGMYDHSEIVADDIGYSYLLAAAFDITDTLRFGVTYRAETDYTCEGDIEFQKMAMLNSDLSGDITLPQSLMLGLNWQATEKLNLGFKATWTDWSCLANIPIDFDSPMLPDSKIDMNWHDTWRYSIGAEYKYNENWSFQCGFTRDLDPSDAGYANTLVPPGDREQAAIGATYSKDDWSIGVNYAAVFIQDTERKVHGVPTTYEDLLTHAVGVSYSKSF